MAPVLLLATVLDPALKVMPVAVPISHCVAVPLTLNVEAPSVRDRVFELLLENRPAVTVWPLVLRDPLVSVMVPDVVLFRIVSASWSVHPPPTPSNVTVPGSDFPAVVIVLPVVVETNFITAAAFGL